MGALEVLGEYRGLVFVDKPAGLQTEPDARHADTLVHRIAAQLGVALERVHALSRLDTGVSGVVTLGLTSDARRMVNEWRALGRFRRRYLAIASGELAMQRGTWSESIGRGSGNLRRIGGRNPETAQTNFAWVASTPCFERANPKQLHLFALAPKTGRTHQLRVHASAHGLPLLGDRAYGGTARLISTTGSVRGFARIALHAAWIELPLDEPRRIVAPVPQSLFDAWRDWSGDDAAFRVASQLVLGA